MNLYYILVDGLPYMGENPDETYQGGEPWSNRTFHTSRQELNVLEFGASNDSPKIISGNRGLRSEIDKILRRVEDGWISFATLEIHTAFQGANE